MILFAAIMSLAASAAYYLFMLRRPWGGFGSFDCIARECAMRQATSIGVFIPGVDDA